MSASTAVNYDMSVIENRAPNVGRQFFDRVSATPNREAYRYPKGERWESQTWQETGDHVTKLAAGLVALGIEPEQRVGIASGTRFEWILADLAVMCAGAATTTVYPSTMADDVGYILGRLRVPGGLRRGRHPDRQARRAQGRAAAPRQGRDLRRRRPTATG